MKRVRASPPAPTHFEGVDTRCLTAYCSSAVQCVSSLRANRAGAPVDAQDPFGNTVLHTACQNGNKRIVKACMRCGRCACCRSRPCCIYLLARALSSVPVPPLALSPTFPSSLTSRLSSLSATAGDHATQTRRMSRDTPRCTTATHTGTTLIPPMVDHHAALYRSCKEWRHS